MSSEAPSRACFWGSLSLIAFIYLSAIWTIIEIKQFICSYNLNAEFFKCRQPILHIIYIISILFVLYILNPITLFLSNVKTTNSQIPLFINDIADILIFLVFFPRAWILWFDRAFTDNIKNWLWRREINIKDSNCLIKHRKHLTSPHILVYSIYLLFIAPIFMILHILPYLNIIPLYCHVIRVGLLLTLLTSTSIIVYSISTVSDEYSIRSELLSSIQTSGIAYVFSHIFYIIIKEIWFDQYWALLIELTFVCIAHLCVVYYACCWTRKRYIFAQKLKLMHHMKAHNGRRSSFSSFLKTSVQFQDIMDHKDGIQAFCNHLVDEFGLESVLFLLEVTQFKGIIRRLSNNTLEDNVRSLCDWHSTDVTEQLKYEIGLKHKFNINKHAFSAASILNISWLPIDPRMFSLTPYQIALHLYDKYIEESSDLCINISFGIRKEIYRYFKELSHQQNNVSMHNIQININDETHAIVKMYKIYDNAFTEIWRLIQTDSFHRFKATPEFMRLISVIVPEEAAQANANVIKMIDEEMRKERNNAKKLKKQQKSIRKKLSVLKTGKPGSPVIDILQNNFPDIFPKSDGLDGILSASDTVHSTDFILPNQNNISHSFIDSMMTTSMVTINSTINSEETNTITNSNPMDVNIKSKQLLELPKLHYQQHSLPCFKKENHSDNINDLPKLQFSHSL